ncbi:MAG: S10 family peptidase [Candidatus Tyrphobacter sp.]
MLRTLSAAALVAALAASGAPHALAIPAATPDAVTHHTIVLHGHRYAYTARAGTITLKDDHADPTCRVFYVAYTLDGANPNGRPVTFLYNGGPGSSTMWLHMGSVGPKRVVTNSNATQTAGPPYRIVDNPYSILDRSDLVFIDMPDSGFGRIIGKGKPADFFGVDPDVAAFAQFIERYITKFDRWNSPKFLFGESYGTTRSANLVNYLQNAGITVDGVVLQSSILSFALDWSSDPTGIGGGDWLFVLYLPTEAATAWYHHAVSYRGGLQSFTAAAAHFAVTEYLDALAQGSALSAPAYDNVLAKLHYYTGLSQQYLRNSNLRVPYWRFESELLRERGKIVGRLDSRFETWALDRTEESPDWDPTDAGIDAPYTTAVNEYLREDLHYNPPLLYRSSVYDIIAASGGWNWKHNGTKTTNVAVDLAQALTYNKNLRVFSANGYYDFATPYYATVYTLTHLGLVPAIQRHISFGFYPSGHMIYLNVPSLSMYHDDLERWYARTLAGR